MAGYIPAETRREKGIRISIIVVSILVLVGVIIGSWAVHTQREIAGGVLRLHILANSDDAMDQELKLNVRDRILTECGHLFRDAKNVQDAGERATNACKKIKTVAEKELRRQGVLYPVTVAVEETTFPTKDYGGVHLPAGRYQALTIRIGSATGQNWWCVLYPPLCLTGGAVKADAETLDLLRQELSAEEYALVTQTEEIHIRTKFYILEHLGKYFSK